MSRNLQFTIPDELIEMRFIRASGPGGQNVNKVSSAVQLRFRLDLWHDLAPTVRARLQSLAGRRLGSDGTILLDAREYRTQEQNKRAALARLQGLIATAMIEPKRRRATRPTKASKERRLAAKKTRSAHKSGRAKIDRQE